MRSASGLRVIEGGRGMALPGCGEDARKQARRRVPSGRVKRRRRMAAALLVLLAAGIIAYVLLGPVTRVIESRRNLSRLENQLAEEKSRTAYLEERKAWDLTENFVELEARKMGYVKPGEIPIIVLDYQEEEETAAGGPTEEAPGP